MEHPELLRSQIRDSCRLALPEGLKDLMSDITREVLRAQPPDIYTFITEYLSALIITRDSLSIACKICRDVCECSCLPHLEEELRYIGLEEADVEHVKDIVLKYFEKDEVKETNLLMMLFKNTNIDEDMLQAIQEAVRRAYLRHQMEHPKKYEMPTRASQSVENTLRIYQGSDEDRNEKATKIQALFRGYLVRKKQKKPPVNQVKMNEKQSEHKKFSFSSVSSQSLAGSFLHLPKYVPYSAHYMALNEAEECYFENPLEYTQESTIRDVNLLDNKKKIGFDNNFILYEIDTTSCPRNGGCPELDDDDDIEESINEEKSTEEHISDICDEVEELEEDKTGGIATDDDMVTENEIKASFSRNMVQEIRSKENEKYKGFECLMPFGELDDGKSSKNERDDDDFLDDLCELNYSHPNLSDEEIEEDITNKDPNTKKESIRTLNDGHRDLSIMIKPVDEMTDLKSPLSKIIAQKSKEKQFARVQTETEAQADLQEKVIREKRYSAYLDD